jgi:hypothetical protein
MRITNSHRRIARATLVAALVALIGSHGQQAAAQDPTADSGPRLLSPAAEKLGRIIGELQELLPALREVDQGARQGGEVHGYATVMLRKREISTLDQFLLPDVTAFVRNVDTGVEGPRVATDLKGFFAIPVQPPGRYEVCVEARGYHSECPQEVTVASETVFLPLLALRPIDGVVAGTVLLQDGSPCNFADPLFGVSFATHVRFEDATGKVVAGPVRANLAGEYVLTAVPVGTGVVRASCQAAEAKRQVVVAALASLADLELPNRPPRNVVVRALDGDEVVRRAAPGATVELVVTAEDDGPLSYRWAASSAGFVSQDASTVAWPLAAAAGETT